MRPTMIVNAHPHIFKLLQNMHRPGDDDSAAVTFWGKRDLRVTLRRALELLDAHYAKRDRDPLRNNPVVGFMSEKQAEEILEEMRDERR